MNRLIRKAEVDESLFMSVSNKGVINPSANQSSFSGTFIPSNVASPSLSRSFALSQIYNTSLPQSPANLPGIFNTTGYSYSLRKISLSASSFRNLFVDSLVSIHQSSMRTCLTGSILRRLPRATRNISRCRHFSLINQSIFCI